MLSYAMLYNVLCSVMFISRYRTCIVYVMLYNMSYLCYITCYFMLRYITCYVYVILCSTTCYVML